MDQQTVQDVIRAREAGPSHFNGYGKEPPDVERAVILAVVRAGHLISQRRFATCLLILGVLSLAYGLFEKFQVASAVEAAPVHMGLGSPWFLNLPLMVGWAAIFAGACLLIYRAKS